MSAESTNALLSGEPAGRARPSLRERKKERTRRTIRTEAFRLFREQGYTETTVEQIAEAADVSPSTFFRYFPSKEELVLADDLDPPMIQAIDRQPPGKPILAAIRDATIDAFGEIDPETFEFERERVALVYSVPELRGAVTREFERNIALMSGIVARRLGRDEEDFEVRALVGALTGAMFALIGREPFSQQQIVRVIDFLESGMRI
ncbi:TetR family transcriptional regulator [Nocardia sp. NBC_01503]|uniref:acyl-CoA-like ligand-binding transcription factor n=1 Tax=Nocardia sp. NBC_01503 TaxID=2975997 RepID=UPI002E7C20B3|nr:TetR family transcriptional regulator [Nocardia sp. NBC_01503]WTL33771.1 TetR family transcriptional regulator [Nocardia sp. NBC_01503]